MDQNNISFDVSDIQLPPTDSINARTKPPPKPPSNNFPTIPGIVPQYNYWRFPPPVATYSAQPVYYHSNYYTFAQRFISPAVYRPQYIIPAKTALPTHFRPAPVKRQSLVRPFQLKKKELAPNPNLVSTMKSPVIGYRPNNKRVNRFDVETWPPSQTNQNVVPNISPLDGIGDVKISIFKQKNPLELTLNAASKKRKNRLKKNQASLANELEKMKATQEFVTEHDMSSLVVTKTAEMTAQHQSRVQRFTSQLGNAGDVRFHARPTLADDYIMGTCVELEKQFYRITSDIDPSKVRPERILKKSLELVKEVWDEEGDYSYVSDQLKSIRQDLTVQGVRNNFSVSVYEAHARISLLAGDISEFGQCLTQIRLLLALPECSSEVTNEFTCYYILNCIFTQFHRGIMETIGGLDKEENEDEFISVALRLQRAYQTYNYSLFFETYHNFPGLGKFIINWFVDRFRIQVLTVLCQAYRPTILIEVARKKLGFDTLEKCMEFLLQQGVVIDGDSIDCRKNMNNNVC